MGGYPRNISREAPSPFRTLACLGLLNLQQSSIPPMGAILALGKASPRVTVRDDHSTIATVLTATLSCDHRVIDGAIGAQFLVELEEVIKGL